MIFVISLLLIAVGLVGTILIDSVLMQIVSAALCVGGVILLVYYYQHKHDSLRSKNKVLKGNLKQLEEELRKMQEKTDEEIKNLRNIVDSSVPDMSSDFPIEQRVKILRSYFLNQGKNMKEYERLFAELDKAVKNQNMLKDINKNFTSPLLDRLNGTNLPLEEKDKRDLTSRLLQLSLIAIDYTQEYRSTHNGEDSLALRVATGKISQEEAASQAVKANSNIYETEKTIRVLWNLVTALGHTDTNLIIHDTLLQSKE